MPPLNARLMLRRAGGNAAALAAALLSLVIVLPALLMLAAAFIHEGGLSPANMKAAYSDPARLAELMANSLISSCGAAAVALALGTPLGFLCFRTDMPGRRLIAVGALLAACLPVYVTATAWMAMTGMHAWLQNAWGASWLQGVAYAPLVLIITGTCFATADRTQEEDAMLNTGRRGVCWHVSLPQGSWGIAIAAIAVIIICLCDITVTDILVVRTFSEEVFTQFQLGSGAGRASAVSLPLTAAAALLGWLAWRICRHHGQASIFDLASPPPVIRLGHWRFAFLLLSLAVVTAFFVVPMFFLIRAVGSPGNMVTAVDTAGRELMVTLRTAPLAATVCVILSFAAANYFGTHRRARWALAVLLIVLIATPGPILGIGISRMLSSPLVPEWIYNSEAVIVWAYVLRTIPFSTLVLLPALRRIPPELNDLMLLSGAGWFRRLVSVTVPLCWRDAVAAWVITFVLSVSELGASFIVSPPGHSTLTLRFFTLIHYGVYPDAAGICLTLLGIVCAAAVLLAVVLWPSAGKLLPGRRA